MLRSRLGSVSVIGVLSMALIISKVETDWDADQKEVIDKALENCELRWSDSLDSGIFDTDVVSPEAGVVKKISTVYLNLSDPEYEQKMADKYDFAEVASETADFEIPHNKRKGRIVVAGFGPAGMFAALILAEHGYNPLVLERGSAYDDRTKFVKDFLENGILSEKSNLKYGEGGSRAFTDNMLSTTLNDPYTYYVLKKMIEFGAPKEILTQARPKIPQHIMKRVIQALRFKIIDCGGEVRFGSQLTAINKDENGGVKSVTVNAKYEEKCDRLILAFGQNASDMYGKLKNSGFVFAPRPYIVGCRIEHLRKDVDLAVYGEVAASDKGVLPPAEYGLTADVNGRKVFTYHCCGGGGVMPAQATKNAVSVDGAVRFNNSSNVTTSAICVSVAPSDFGSSDPLSGVAFQRDIEEKAFNISNSHRVPATSVRGFLENSPTLSDLPFTSTYPIGTTVSGFRDIFPNFVVDSIKDGIMAFAKQLKCFNNGKAILTAPESRIISPVKFNRGDNFAAEGIGRVFVCGECAGYTEGIMNSAVEGLGAALALANS
jgi:uncharacterized FAD-dependent dehydrogenase